MSNIMFKNYYTDSFQKENKYILAGFDLDHTIIKPKSGNVFPKNKDDWKLLFSEVKTTLQNIQNNNIIVIFSNQKGLKISEEEYISKIDDIQKMLGIEFIFIAALDDDIFRKPRIGMYRYIKQQLNIKINKKESFYVGDMAGRANDMYDTDIKFAMNMGIKFMTPEMYFLGMTEEEHKLSGYMLNNTNTTNTLPTFIAKPNNMIIISGYPGSGKTFLANNIKNNNDFILISKDIYKNKFDNILLENLKLSNPIIIEGLFPNNMSRYKIKEFANIYNYNITYIHVTTNYDLSYHLNLYRKIYDNKNHVPEIVYMKYRNIFEPIIMSDWNKTYEYHPEITNKINKFFLY